MNRRVGDGALLLARLLLGVILFAHGYQKLVVDGIGRTSQGFERMTIPLAIVSSSFVTVVEVVGAVLLVAGVLTATVAVLMGLVMVGAAAYVHVPHGVFVADGGWELVGAIGAALLALAAAGPGRWSVEHVLRRRRDATARPLVPPALPGSVPPAPGPPAPGPPTQSEPIPPAGLPLTPLVRLAAPLPGRRRP